MNVINGITGAERLGENNYATWKIQIKSMLVYNELWGYISGEIKKPTDDGAAREWSNKDAKALALITLSVKENQLGYIKKASSSKAAWDELEKIHASKGPARKVVLYKKIFQLKKGTEESMSEYLRKFQDILDEIESTGLSIPSELCTIMLLNSLPDSYENFCIAIETKDSMPSIEMLKVKLLEEENRRNDVSNENATVSAYISSKENFKRNQKKYVKSNWNNKSRYEKFNGNCYCCGKYGHKVTECKMNKVNKRHNEQNKQNLLAMTI